MKIFQNEQEVFDAVWAHLHKQGVACVNSGNDCVYLNEETGTSCAIGGILPPEIDRAAIDRTLHGSSSNIGALIRKEDSKDCMLVKEVFSKIEISFLEELQEAHDQKLNGGFLNIWRDEMCRIAEIYDLKVPNEF